MRNFFWGIWRIVTFPFRLAFGVLAFPFRKIRQFHKFLNTEPDERPLTDLFVELTTNKDTRQMLWDQIEALRMHILRAVIALVITVITSIWITQDLMEFLAIPVQGLEKLRSLLSLEWLFGFSKHPSD